MERIDRGTCALVFLALIGLPFHLDAQITRTVQSDGVIRYEKTISAAQPPSFWQMLYDMFNWKSSRRPFNRSVAFLAGVSEYDYIEPDLVWVASDLDQLRNYLLNKAGFDIVYEARDKVVNTELIENYMINRFPKEATAEDRLLFYFSGHGADIGGSVGYMQFAGARPDSYSANNYLPIKRCEEWGRLNKSKHALFLLDCCASGLGFATKSGANVDAELLDTFSGSGSRYIMTAGTAREKAFQVEESASKGYSVFTRALLDSLADASSSSSDRGFVILDEVYAGIKVRVARFSSQGSGRAMTPQLWPIPRDEKDKGTFVFLNPEARGLKVPTAVQQALAVVPKDAGEPIELKPDQRLQMAMLAYESLKDSKNIAALRRFVEENDTVPGAGWMVEVFKERIDSLLRETPLAKAIAQEPRPGEVKTNPADGLPYVWIPPDQFNMGCSPDDNECDGDEKPPHNVRITKGFWLGQTEVTQAAYEKVTEETPSYFKGANLPVENVTWDQARKYCEAVNGRLPTEAEWEYAARARSTQPRYGALDAIAWFGDNSGNAPLDSDRAWNVTANRDSSKYLEILNKNGNRTREPGKKQPNTWGLYDMLGNVWEWTSDRYGSEYYKASPSTDPKGPESGEYRVVRGGSWYYNPRFVRASSRVWNRPDDRDFNLGFRCAWE